MWNGTHTKACNLNGYESVMCLTMIACPGLYFGFPDLWVLSYLLLIPCFILCIHLLPVHYLIIPVHTCSNLSVSWVFLTWYHLLYAYLCSNPPVFCTWHLCSSWLATWPSYYYSPGEFHWLPWILMSRSMELGACGFSLLLIRVAQW